MKNPFMMDLQLFATDDVGGGETDTQGDTEGTETDEGIITGAKVEGVLTEDDVRKMIQSETDRVRTEYVQRLRAVESERDELKKQSMSEKEKAEFEAQQRAEELAAKERTIRERELALFAVDALREKELPLEFRDFIIGADEDATTERMNTLAKVFGDAVEAAVSARFADGGRDPHGGGGNKPKIKNPWAKEAWNLTEQMRITRNDPELAKQLRAAAGR